MSVKNIDKLLVDYLLTCPDIYNSKLYFNLADIKDGVNQYLTMTNPRTLEKRYVDGSVEKTFSATFICYLSITSNPIVKQSHIINENIADIGSVQALMDWIEEQNTNKNFPDLGENCVVEEIYTTTISPMLSQIDASNTIPLGRYTFTINLRYTDETGIIWNE